jgi:hypothetical protein
VSANTAGDANTAPITKANGLFENMSFSPTLFYYSSRYPFGALLDLPFPVPLNISERNISDNHYHLH